MNLLSSLCPDLVLFSKVLFQPGTLADKYVDSWPAMDE